MACKADGDKHDEGGQDRGQMEKKDFFRPHGELVMKSKGCGRELSSCASNGSEM